MTAQVGETERRTNTQLPKTKGSFMSKLTQILKMYPEVIGWTEEGSQIRVSNIERMEKQIIPAYYRHSNINSFVRQLNMYYFSKLQTHNKNQMIFQNKDFSKENQDGLHLIQRRNKGRDQMISHIHQQFSNTIHRVNNHTTLNEETKAMLISAIEYEQVVIKNLQKIKNYLINLSNQMKTSRGKEVRKILQNFKSSYPQTIETILKQGNSIEKYIQTGLCPEDENNQVGSQNFPLVSRSFPNQSLPIFVPRQSSLSMLHNERDYELESQSSESGKVSFLQDSKRQEEEELDIERLHQ